MVAINAERRGALIAIFVAFSVVAGGCNTAKAFRRYENVAPPAAGVPASPSAVVGIYRNIDQGVLQLRRNGDINLTTATGADSGVYTLTDGHLEVHSGACRAIAGAYHLEVTGPRHAGEAALHFTAERDDCAVRRDALTARPWVYANS